MLDLEAFKGRQEKARAEVSALCNGKRWKMTIPADRNRDSDLVIAAALDDAAALLSEVERLQNLWTCQTCGAMFPHTRGDDDIERCSKCVEVDVLLARLRGDRPWLNEL